MDESIKVQSLGYPLNYGDVEWTGAGVMTREAALAAVGGVGSGLDGEEGAVGIKVGVCAGEDVSGSEETTMAGELWPPGMVMTEGMEEADGLFRVEL